MARPKVKSTVSRAGKYDAACDVKAIGRGTRSLRDMFAPPTPAFTPIVASCDVRSKDIGAIF